MHLSRRSTTLQNDEKSYCFKSVSEPVHRRIRLIRRNNWFLSAWVRHSEGERVCSDENRRQDSAFFVQLRTIIDGGSREVIQAQAPGNCMNHPSFHGQKKTLECNSHGTVRVRVRVRVRVKVGVWPWSSLAFTPHCVGCADVKERSRIWANQMIL
jgi:hypothetical protein